MKCHMGARGWAWEEDWQGAWGLTSKGNCVRCQDALGGSSAGGPWGCLACDGDHPTKCVKCEQSLTSNLYVGKDGECAFVSGDTARWCAAVDRLASVQNVCPASNRGARGRVQMMACMRPRMQGRMAEGMRALASMPSRGTGPLSCCV